MIFNFYWQHPRTWNHLIHSQNRSVPSSIFNRALRRGRNQNLSEHLLTTPANPEENERRLILAWTPKGQNRWWGQGGQRLGRPSEQWEPGYFINTKGLLVCWLDISKKKKKGKWLNSRCQEAKRWLDPCQVSCYKGLGDTALIKSLLLHTGYAPHSPNCVLGNIKMLTN